MIVMIAARQFGEKVFTIYWRALRRPPEERNPQVSLRFSSQTCPPRGSIGVVSSTGRVIGERHHQPYRIYLCAGCGHRNHMAVRSRVSACIAAAEPIL
jgi:hypothetical protein